MPECKKCGKAFPFSVVIEGKQRNLKNRRYCLDCSPFGLHNTRQLETDNGKQVGDICECEECSRVYAYEHRAGHTTTLCNSCVVNRRRFMIKDKCVEYKGNECIVCGYNRCSRNMTFHHLDPELKEFGISGNHSKSWENIRSELDKCVMLCSNCHGETHNGLIELQTLIELELTHKKKKLGLVIVGFKEF